MAAPSRAPRTRASGGRTLMLLGVLLALAAGTIVIYIVSQATTTSAQTVMVVMAKINITPGQVLTVGPTDPSKNALSVADAFVAKQVSADYAPPDYLPFVSQDQLNVKLNNQVVIGAYYAGDILRTGDFTARLAALGAGAPGSLTNVNPAELPTGDVLMAINLQGGGPNGKPLAAAGDRVDIIIVACNLGGDAKDPNGCEAQTTLQDVYVYSSTTGQIIVVVTHQQALEILYIQHIGTAEIVIRKPGDDGKISTNPVDNGYIVAHFGF